MEGIDDPIPRAPTTPNPPPRNEDEEEEEVLIRFRSLEFTFSEGSDPCNMWPRAAEEAGREGRRQRVEIEKHALELVGEVGGVIVDGVGGLVGEESIVLGGVAAHGHLELLELLGNVGHIRAADLVLERSQELIHSPVLLLYRLFGFDDSPLPPTPSPSPSSSSFAWIHCASIDPNLSAALYDLLLP